MAELVGALVRIDVQGQAEIARAFEAAPAIVIEELTKATVRAQLLLERETKELTPVGVGAGGGLRGSIAAREPEVLADRVIGEVGTSLAYAVPVELGSRPHFPPIAPLEDWVKSKLGVPEKDANRVAFAVARKIARRGTEGAFMFKRAFDANRAQVARFFEDARARIVARIEDGR